MMNPYHIVENSIHIAWDYLEATGELGDPEEASQVLLNEIQSMVRGGETNQNHFDCHRCPLSDSGRAAHAF